MGLVNSLRPQVDRPVWEWLRFAPAVSSAVSSSTTAANSNFHLLHGRYLYYLIAAGSFWKYDTWSDTYLQLASPPTAPVAWSSMRFLSSFGVEGRVLAATAGSITIPAYFGQVLKGFEVLIVSGTGAGQRRVISGVADATVADAGVPTAVSAVSPQSLTDATKAWTPNQWAGYQLRIVYGSGLSQVRRILYNTATVLTFGDTSKTAEDAFCNPAVPTPALSAAAMSQSMYQIESSVASINQNWTVTPDVTSRFRVMSGAIVLMSQATNAVTIQWYDVASDLWYVKSCPTLVLSTGTSTDGSIEASDESIVTWERGSATGGTTTTLIDSTQQWRINQWVGYSLYIFSGTAAGQVRKITANTATTFTFAAGTAPDSTSRYLIFGYDTGLCTAGSSSSLTDTTQAWTPNRWKNFAVRILAGTGAGQVLPIHSNTSTTLTTVRSWSTNPDTTSVYAIVPNQDQIHLLTGGTTPVYCYSIEDDLLYLGRWNDSGVCRIGAVTFGSMKPQGLVSITKSGTTATAMTVNPIGFPSGSAVTVGGATGADAASYNITAIATLTGLNTFTYPLGTTPAGNAVFTPVSTTTLVDATKAWIPNQWTGFLCHLANTTGSAPTGQTMLISSNTANKLTFAGPLTIPVNGVTRYVLTPNTIPGALAAGVATGTGQSTTALVDTTQNWVVNQWAGRKIRITGGSGQGTEQTIQANTATTITPNAPFTLPVVGQTTYAILGQATPGTGIEIRHAFGLSDSQQRGKYLVSNRGGGGLGFNRLNLTTDQYEPIATSPNSETLTTGSMFAYDGVDRLYFTKEATQRVYYLDLVTQQIHGAGIYPYVPGTATVGNRFEIFTTADGLKFLWLNRHSNLECFRSLLFW